MGCWNCYSHIHHRDLLTSSAQKGANFPPRFISLNFFLQPLLLHLCQKYQWAVRNKSMHKQTKLKQQKPQTKDKWQDHLNKIFDTPTYNRKITFIFIVSCNGNDHETHFLVFLHADLIYRLGESWSIVIYICDKNPHVGCVYRVKEVCITFRTHQYINYLKTKALLQLIYN